jgi:ATP-dependent DNA helicase pcrA
MSFLLDALNDKQKEAVSRIEGPLLIIAGAGSGKTKVITHRIAYMLEKGILQSNILALTFTNKAAREMNERISQLLGKKCPSLTINTFHAFGVKVLREHIELLGWRANFSIYDETDKNDLIKECAKEIKLSDDALDVYKIANIFSNIKMGRRGFREDEAIYEELYEEYQERLKLFNAVDFDDLIMLPIELLSTHKEVLETYKKRYKYIMVDEFQDTSMQQYNFIHLIAEKNICVVGDDDQSIYSWRGANFENIRKFEEDYPDLLEVKLEQNYRSTGTILAAANGIISHNVNRKEKALWSAKGSGLPIEFYMPETETDEADFIAEMIESYKRDEGLKYSDFGILLRTNSLTRNIEESLLETNIPYRVTGGTSFFQRKEIKDIISYLRVATNPDDDVNLLRIINTPPRGIGKTTIKAVSEVATEKKISVWKAIDFLITNDSSLKGRSVEDLESFVSIINTHRTKLLQGKNITSKVNALIEEIEYLPYLEKEFQKNEKLGKFKAHNIEAFLQSIERWELNPYNEKTSIYDYLNRITLLTRDDEEEGGEVALMTIHSAKGLEFPVVFIAGVEEGLLPHERSIEEGKENIEEERRLFYVAVTRARQKLFITSCKTRRRAQGIKECKPSPFIEEIPKELINYYVVDEEKEELRIEDLFEQCKKKFGKQ